MARAEARAETRARARARAGAGARAGANPNPGSSPNPLRASAGVDVVGDALVGDEAACGADHAEYTHN